VKYLDEKLATIEKNTRIKLTPTTLLWTEPICC
jgi:hypothetical protein